eukprot:CAMPEP_0116875136 /NCGR_PEP_ID=MMETSP0463-20121206/6922_1 /TAXON_ID=181622 /ORGANISM="Strombidinopsis sp, Strain SopsisLIS2011" /LENGTH=49 /DNA_ID=CAMNT_0004520127 /DNA_START=371 /DNA_END=520 /DNA_ORIENTATION=+
MKSGHVNFDDSMTLKNVDIEQTSVLSKKSKAKSQATTAMQTTKIDEDTI